MDDSRELPEPGMDPAEYRRLRNPHSDASSIERARAESPPERAAWKHGLYSQRLEAMPCDNKCRFREVCPRVGEEPECVLERQWMEWRKPLIARAVEEDGGDPVLLDTHILIAVHAEIRYRRAYAIVQIEGEFRRDPKTGELVETAVSLRLSRCRNEVMRVFEDLGLSPMARAKLEGTRQQGGANMLIGLVHEIHSGEQVQEAEFEAAPEGPPAASDEQRATSEDDEEAANHDGSA